MSNFKKFIIAVFLFIVFTGGVSVWFIQAISPVAKKSTATKMFLILPNSKIRTIAQKLYSENLIRSPLAFLIIIKLNKLENKIQAGDFKLSPSMSTEQIAKYLTVGTLDIWVTIPEGKRAEQVAQILKEKMPNSQDATTKLRQEEGYLFPDTYLFPKDADINQIINIMTTNFKRKIELLPKIPANQDELKKIVIVASLIEREARHLKDQPLVASVIYNRLKIGMPLQIDATVQYALGYQKDTKNWWKRNLTLDDLKINSPYNTYQNTGLPPGPIASPGLNALKAASQPAVSSYLYYVSDKYGNNHYATTAKEHEANIKKYGL